MRAGVDMARPVVQLTHDHRGEAMAFERQGEIDLGHPQHRDDWVEKLLMEYSRSVQADPRDYDQRRTTVVYAEDDSSSKRGRDSLPNDLRS